MSSIQSVAGQPDAAPLSRPRHHGVLPELLSWPVAAVSWSHVFGVVDSPAADACLGSYQIRPLAAALTKIPYCLPSTLTRSVQDFAYCWLPAFVSITPFNATSL